MWRGSLVTGCGNACRWIGGGKEKTALFETKLLNEVPDLWESKPLATYGLTNID